MTDLILILAVLVALMVLGILAIELGSDSRQPMRPSPFG
jgi:hypothetical protein